MQELGRICGKKSLREDSLRKWKEVVPCVLDQAKLEKRNKGVCSALEACESINSKCFSCLCCALK